MFSFLGYIPDTLGVVGVEILPAGVLQEPKATTIQKNEKTDSFALLFPLSSQPVSLDSYFLKRIFLGCSWGP
jgi:hypothetical protein